ncbi:MAG: site-2 protease family protein [Kaiparowitsia implicata GSE-PSE-MK54-09C]|jgi:Zn-dependent protease|nr:site-2 protease family protein [Kaiparowitsia implicata GSE-PSE-MK54-09C]
MQPGRRVGTIFGIPLLIDSSWFIILALFTFSNAMTLQRGAGFDAPIAWVAGLILALALFGSVLLHELGHSLVAKFQGIKVNSITLFLFGGVAAIEEEPKTPGRAFQVAIAGPAVSLALFFILAAASQVLALPTAIANMVRDLAYLNGVLAIFNMIPGLPLDGGQVLRAAVWKITGSRIQGLRWAANAGKTLGWFAIFLGILLYVRSPQTGFSAVWLAVIGWFVMSQASSYSRISDLQAAIAHLTASAAMTRHFRVVDANITVDQFNTQYIQREGDDDMPAFYASSDGRYRGMVLLDDLQGLERSQWDVTVVHYIVHPLTDIPSIAETAPLQDVIEKLEAHNLRYITVLSPAEAVSGVIDRGDVVRAVAQQMKVPIPEGIIRKIKLDGSYPSGLPLEAIVKSMGTD